MGELIDGKALAKEVRAEVEGTGGSLRRCGTTASLGSTWCSSERIRRHRCTCETRNAQPRNTGLRARSTDFPASTSEADLLALVFELNGDDNIDGILVQLPLPDHLDDQTIVDAIDPAKDVDGLHPFKRGAPGGGAQRVFVHAPRAAACACSSTSAATRKGKRALVLGRSTLVGKPIAMMLLEKHADGHHRALAHGRASTSDAERPTSWSLR